MGYHYPASVRGDLRAGRLRAALARLRTLKRPDRHTRLAIADLLQQTGHHGEAVAELRHEAARGRLDAAERGLAHLVLANAALAAGRRSEALNELDHAIRAADAAGDLPIAGRARIRLLSLLDDGAQPDRTEALVGETRRLVLRCADPHLTAWLHAGLGRRETRRGALDASTKHYQAARHLLAASPNLVVSGVVAVRLCALALVGCRLDEALHEAESGLVDAERSGHAWTLVTSLANLGLAHLRLGRFGEARRALARGLELASAAPQAQITLLGTVAELGLAEGNEQTTADAFARIDALATDHGRRSSRLAGVSLTRARYLLRAGRADEALRVIDLGADAVAPSDRLLRARFLSLRARALVACGRPAEASSVLASALDLVDAAPLGVLAEVEGARSGLLRALCRPDAAELGFARALRLLQAVGDHAALSSARAERAEVGDSGADGNPAPTSPHPLRRSGMEVLTAAAHLVATAEHPALLGAEALAVLEALGAARAARLVQHSPRGARVVRQSIGEASDEDLWRDPRVTTASLGRRPDATLALEVLPHDGLEERAAVASLCRLVNAAVSLDSMRRQAQQQAPLWPVDPPSASVEGIFLAPTMQDVLASVARVAATDLPVLLLGETGTGKEIVARELHRRSNRSARPFVPFNCTAVSRDMLESQLFGYRRGAFTGAQEDFPGVIRGAEGGTLFLDEIGEMTPEMQPKLLRFLECGEIHPLGRTQPIAADVRVIAATNAPLGDLTRSGRFRRDLYYRLNVCRIAIPPLRERPEEIPALVQHFAHRQSAALGRPVPRLSDDAMEHLLLYGWPGNVRQLANEVRRFVALAAPDEIVTAERLAPEILEARRTGPTHAEPTRDVRLRLHQPLGRAIEQLERVMIAHALDAANGSFAAAARQLGITRRGLLMKRRRLGILGERPGRWIPRDDA